MVRLQTLTRPELIFPDLEGSDRAAVLHELAQHLVDRGLVPDADQLYCKLQEREELGSTGIGLGVAIPHCKCPGLKEVLISVGISQHGIDFDAEDGAPVKLVFVVLSPTNQPAEHLQSLAAISRWIRADNHLEQVLGCREPEAIFALLNERPSEPSMEPATSPREPPVAQ